MQGYSGPPELYCRSTDREERFGKAKFGESWIGPQTESDLAKLERVRDRSRDWQTLEPETIPERRAPDYLGPQGDQEVSSALDRALRRKRMLAEVSGLLSLLDRYDAVANPALSELSDGDLKKLDEARRVDLRVDISVAAFGYHDVPTVVADSVPSGCLPLDYPSAAPKAARAKVRKYLVEEIKKSPTRRPKPQKQIYEDAVEKCGHHSFRSFLHEWKEAINLVPGCTWDKGGAPEGPRVKRTGRS